MSAPKEQSKSAASSQMFVRKSMAKKYTPKKQAKKVYQKRYAARGMVQAQNLKRQYIKVEDCTSMYLLSLLDPTAEESRGACIPSGFPMPSQKVRVFTRGSFNTGTTGDGYIVFQPALVNDLSALSFTGSSSVGTASTSLAGFTNVSTASFSKIPFSSAQVVTTSAVAGRVVSACLRVRYAGTEASRSGLISGCEHPDHNNLALYSSNEINTFESTYRERPSGDGAWFCVNWSGPSNPGEVEYANLQNYCGTGIAPLAICINGAAAAASYEYEAWINLEYIGKDTIGKTNNQVDEQGYGNVLQAVKSAAGTKPLTVEAGPSIIEKFGNAIVDNMPQIIGTIGKGIDAFNPGSMMGQAYRSIWGQNLVHPQPSRRLMY